jgi:hypothetical protein
MAEVWETEEGISNRYEESLTRVSRTLLFKFQQVLVFILLLALWKLLFA